MLGGRAQEACPGCTSAQRSLRRPDVVTEPIPSPRGGYHFLGSCSVNLVAASIGGDSLPLALP